MSGTSKVGQASVYENGDQKNIPKSELEQEKKQSRFHEGKENSHKANDSSECDKETCGRGLVAKRFPPEDERTIANKLAREEKVGLPHATEAEETWRERRSYANRKQREGEDEEESEETKALKKDPTLPAKMHGNEPSKGAKIDAQIQAEEEEELRRKGKA
ncbi:hypothetical protein JHW43_005859 [Diplocarpon mali]|nr:hypothetical protein JHW43_005859 [Diplocarpon mali]